MLKQLKVAGVDLTSAHIPCQPCDLTRSGGFSPDVGAVVLCQGNFLNKKHMEHALVHELLHMYDHAVFIVDWSNLRYHACSEVCLLTHIEAFTNIIYTFYKIRANSLSGDCSWAREIQRGRFFSK
jgi:mitochondrial inner membrane protease ATP23